MLRNRIVILLVIVFILTSIDNNVFAESLYDEQSFQSLVADNKAFKVGDSITILVIEAARAESRAGTDSEMSTNIRAQVTDTISSHNAGMGIGLNSGGDAVTSRHGFVSAQLAVSVVAINGNSMLEVEGEQTIIINGEEQKIMISGAVRREDIGKDNTLLSNRLNNAHIEFSGDGVVANAQDTGVVYKILQWLGLV